MISYKIKKILVPFDFSHSSLNALKVADKFAAEFNSQIELINIIEPRVQHEVGMGRSGSLYLPSYREKAHRALDNYLNQVSINPNAYSYNEKHGFCNNTIIDLVKDNKYDLVILPDNPKHPLRILGTKYHPLKIMENTKVPVIAVNKYYRIVEFRNIILPIRNMANWYDKLPFMISLVQQTGGKIHAVGLDESKSGAQFNNVFEQAVSILERENVLSTVKKIEGENCLGHLKHLSAQLNGDLIAVTPPQNNKLIPSIFRPSLYSRLIPESPAPVFGVKLS